MSARSAESAAAPAQRTRRVPACPQRKRAHGGWRSDPAIRSSAILRAACSPWIVVEVQQRWAGICDAAGLISSHIRTQECIKKRCLPMIYMSQDCNDTVQIRTVAAEVAVARVQDRR